VGSAGSSRSSRPPAAGATGGLQIEYANDRYVSLAHVNGNLRAPYKAGTFQIVATLPYVPAQHRFWAISEDAGTIYYETSQDGVSFTSFANLLAPFDVSLVRIYDACDGYLRRVRWREGGDGLRRLTLSATDLRRVRWREGGWPATPDAVCDGVMVATSLACRPAFGHRVLQACDVWS